MAAPLASSLLHYIRSLASRGAGPGEVSDAKALQRFVAARDEAAFELLVWRYGAMVLRLCRGILHDEHAAEDAFQATFFVLARKARTVIRHGSLAGWLYRVAYHISLKAQAKARNSQTQGSELLGHVLDTTAGDPAEMLAQAETRLLLYAEVNRLPAKYRDPVVLYHLQGQTHEEAARQLGWPVGTVSGRLARARALLQKRLTARGVVLPAGLFAAAVADGSSLGAGPASLMVATIQAALPFAVTRTVSAAVSPRAAALAEGVLKAMFLNRIKVVVSFVLAVGMLSAGAAWEAGVFAAPEQTTQQTAAEKAARQTTESKRLMAVPSPIDGIIVVIGEETIKEGKQKPRRLQVGDRVKEGEMLARLDDRLARNELAIQKAKLSAAKAAFEAAVKTKYEAQARLDRADRLLQEAGRKGSIISAEDYSMAVITRDKEKYEEESKKAALDIAKLELERAMISLGKHVIRSPVTGAITAIYKERGEAVRRLEPVFQIEMLPNLAGH